MSEKLILRMSSQPTSSIPWLVYSDTTNEVIVSGELEHQGELPNLTQYAQGRQITVLANSADVRLHQHFMATKPTRQIIKALPFMLEDELAEDIDALHIAPQDSGFDKALNKFWLNIAIVNKSMIQQWMEVLSAAGLHSKRFIPESLCMPYDLESNDRQLSMLALGNGWVIREDEWQGRFVESQWLPIYVSQLTHKNQGDDSVDGDEVEGTAGNKNTASQLLLQSYSPLPNDVKLEFENANGVALVEAEPELPMLLLAKGANLVKWNLLQGELAPKKQVSKNWQIWRSVGVIALLVFVLEFVSKAVHWHNVEQDLVRHKAELVSLYQSAFPKEKVRVALLKRQLTRKVAAVSGGVSTSDDGFLKLMLKLTPVLQQHSGVESESFRYDASRGELRISANAPSFQQFEQFRIAIEKLGLEVKQGAVSNEGKIVSGTINVKEVS